MTIFTVSSPASAKVSAAPKAVTATAIVKGTFKITAPASARVMIIPRTAPATAIVKGTFKRIASSVAILAVTPRQSVAHAIVRGTFKSVTLAQAIVKAQRTNTITAKTLVVFVFKKTTSATAIVIKNFRNTISASTITKGTFCASAPGRSLLRGTLSTYAPARAIVIGPATVGIAKDIYSQDATKQVFNIVNNAKIDTFGTGNWYRQVTGVSSRVEIGLDGNFRTFTAASDVRGSVIVWSPLNSGGAGDFVRRTGDLMTGTLGITKPAATGGERWELRYSLTDTDFIFDQYDTSNIKSQILKFGGTTLTYKGTGIVFNNGTGSKSIDFSTGVMTVNGGDVGLGSSTAVYQANGIRFGPNAALTASPGIWNAANTTSANYAFIAHLDYTTVNAKTAGEVRLGVGGVTVGTISSTGLTFASGTRIVGPGSVSTFGALTVDGSKGTYAGINFRTGSTNYGTFMVDTSGAVQGFYNAADNAWLWYWSAGILTAGTVPVAHVSGLSNSATIGSDSANTGGTIVLRDGSGTINVGHINAINALGTGAGANFFSDDIWTYRALSTNTSSLYLNSARDRFLQYNGSQYVFPGASLLVNGTTVPSSRAYKKNIQTIENALITINKLDIVSFSYKDEREDGRKKTGLIYEDVEVVIPEATMSSTDLDSGQEMKSLDYSYIFTLGLRAIQELSAEIEELRVALRKLEEQAPTATKD